MCVPERRKSKDHKRPRRNKKCKELFMGIGLSLLTGFLSIFHIILDKFVMIILELYWGEKKQCPKLDKNLFVKKSAVELAKMIKTKEITSYQVVKGFINRIQEVNPIINAIIDGPFQEALAEAKQIDDRIANGQISEDEFFEKPFLGVPFTTKDSTSVKDKLYTLGILSRQHVLAKEDAECIKRIKDAGGLIIATSSVPEINRWQETRNNIIGQTNNPYDNRRIVGGSSGGEGALVASCGTAFGIGTDIGGSIRMPAFYCGIFGHKPTVGLINTKGCTLRSGKEANTMVVAGPMTKYATDLLPLMKVLVDPSKLNLLKFDEKINLSTLRYFYITESNELCVSPVCSDLKGTMSNVIKHFTNVGAEPPKQCTLSGINKTMKMWRYWMTEEKFDFNQHLVNGGPKLNPFVELFKKMYGNSEFTLASIYSLIDDVLPKENAERIKRLTQKCEDELNELLGDDGILFYPSTVYPAPLHYFPLVKIWNFSYFCLSNVLHVPCTQVPMGLNSEGLPLGIQVIATKNRDRHCLAVAEELEKAYGGWVPPFTTDN